MNPPPFVRAQLEAFRICESTWAQCVTRKQRRNLIMIINMMQTEMINMIQTETRRIHLKPDVGSKRFEIFALVDSILTIVYIFDQGLNLTR